MSESELVYASPPPGGWTAERLAGEASAAREVIGIHGVTGWSSPPAGRFPSATRARLSALGFQVHATPLAGMPNHLTIEVPSPVTPEVARRLDAAFVLVLVLVLALV